YGRRDADRATARWADGAAPWLRGDSAPIMRTARAPGAMGLGTGTRRWAARCGRAPHGHQAARRGFTSSRWEGESHAHSHLSLGTPRSSQRARDGVWPLPCHARAVLPQGGHARRSCVTTPASAKKFPRPPDVVIKTQPIDIVGMILSTRLKVF